MCIDWYITRCLSVWRQQQRIKLNFRAFDIFYVYQYFTIYRRYFVLKFEHEYLIQHSLTAGGTKHYLTQVKEPGTTPLKAGFAKLHVGLVVLVKRMSVLINFLLQNTKLVSVLGKICPNFAGHVWQDWHISWTLWKAWTYIFFSQYGESESIIGSNNDVQLISWCI